MVEWRKHARTTSLDATKAGFVCVVAWAISSKSCLLLLGPVGNVLVLCQLLEKATTQSMKHTITVRHLTVITWSVLSVGQVPSMRINWAELKILSPECCSWRALRAQREPLGTKFRNSFRSHSMNVCVCLGWAVAQSKSRPHAKCRRDSS